MRVIYSTFVAGAAGHGWGVTPVPRAASYLSGDPAGASGTCAVGMCRWFNEGCTIGCPKCNGALEDAGCEAQQGKATLPDYARTVWYPDGVTLMEDCGITPWCAPGSAPVFSPCGIAGGDTTPGAPGAGGEPPPRHKQGEDGLGLKVRPEKTTWKAGSVVEASWALIANHGGGYQYRLCKSKPLPTEECFQQMPLRFADDKIYIQWVPSTNGQYLSFDPSPTRHFVAPDPANRTAIPAVDVREGTVPAGSTWRRNPIPACKTMALGAFGFDCGSGAGTRPDDYQFPPAIPDAMRPGQWLGGFGAGGCYGEPYGMGCQQPPDFGNRTDKLWEKTFQFNVVDKLIVPNVPVGHYTLSFRWDCEQTAQIWATCADIEIVGDGDVAV